MALYAILFTAGVLTILLPCILPLLPIVLGVSIAGPSKWRPFLTVFGMILSFVGFTFLLTVALGSFVEFADYIHISTNYILLLFGLGFAVHWRSLAVTGAILGALFFLGKGSFAVLIAASIGVFLLAVGGRIATTIQQLGVDAQSAARGEFGANSPVTAFLIGLTLGLVWVPCAGPALGFALALVREKPGAEAVLALTVYAIGTGLPLLIIGYGGQAALHSFRSLNRYTGVFKALAGWLLILTAVALHFNVFQDVQVWLTNNTSFGDIGTRIERQLFSTDGTASSVSSPPPSPTSMTLPTLPRFIRAPEFTGLGPWHGSQPFTLASLKGKVVLVDFWTYSCINCIRTLPYIQGYWEKYQSTKKFVLLGVHTPEFTFEKSEKNVAMAIREHGLTYAIAQDNDYGTWSAFANRYWPAKYLIDADGYVRYTHFGEGEYEETDLAIRSLLREAGVDVDGMTPGAIDLSLNVSRRGPVTPETYLSSRSWSAFGNAQGEPTSETLTYSASPLEWGTLVLNTYDLVGTWKLVDDEYEELVSDSGEIRMKFRGGEMNLVLGLRQGVKPVEASVMVDGKPGKTFTIDRHDLYNLFMGDYGEHEMLLTLKGSGVEAFAFTFGS